jgi:hypothetical protein
MNLLFSPLKSSILVATIALTCASSSGAVVGLDTAADTAYNSGWTNGSDGGTPGTFGPWALTSQGANSGRFIGDSTSLSSPGADINTAGESFGMFGHSGQTSEAFRDFNGATLSVGQTFSLDLAANFRNGFKGIDLRDSSDAVIFNFNVGNVGAGDDYTVQFAASGNGSIGNSYSSNTEFHLSFSQTSLSGGTWSVARTGGVTDFDSGTYSGVAENFKIYESQTSGGLAENNLFVNSLEVIPEPATFAFIVAPLLGMACLRRRRA